MCTPYQHATLATESDIAYKTSHMIKKCMDLTESLPETIKRCASAMLAQSEVYPCKDYCFKTDRQIEFWF